MQRLRRLHPAFYELGLLAVAAPLFYFPQRFPEWGAWLGVGLLVALWPLRRALSGRWAVTLPVAGGALWFWLLVMLPIAVWAAPDSLRQQYSLPRAAILLWNFSLFWTLVTHAGRDRAALGWALVGWVGIVQLLALLAPFGLEPRAKLPLVGGLLRLIPRPLAGVFSGAEGGFSTNQLAGTLLYVLPWLLVLTWVGWRARATRSWLWWLMLLCTGWMGGVMLLAQSRSGLVGLGVAVASMGLLSLRRGWLWLSVVAAAVTAAAWLAPRPWLELLADSPGVEVLGGLTTVQNFRTLVWGAAVTALGDFPFTGMGLGTFRELVYLLYPLPGISPTYDLAHAHNFFLQTGLDFGVPGLVAVLLVYGAALVTLIGLSRLPATLLWTAAPYITPRALAVGWMGCLLGQTVYSLFDAVAMGSKPNFVWWAWLALILAAGQLWLRPTPASAADPPPAA